MPTGKIGISMKIDPIIATTSIHLHPAPDALGSAAKKQRNVISSWEFVEIKGTQLCVYKNPFV